MIERFERFSVAISKISYHWHKLAADEMGKYGLKSTHAIYLTTMYRFKEGITAPKLCELCGKDKSDVSRMMSIMEKKGLVKKHAVNQNLYRGLLKLTEEGKKAAKLVCSRARKAVEFAGTGLSEQERNNLYNALELIVANLNRLSKEGIPQQ